MLWNFLNIFIFYILTYVTLKDLILNNINTFALSYSAHVMVSKLLYQFFFQQKTDWIFFPVLLSLDYIPIRAIRVIILFLKVTWNSYFVYGYVTNLLLLVSFYFQFYWFSPQFSIFLEDYKTFTWFSGQTLFKKVYSEKASFHVLCFLFILPVYIDFFLILILFASFSYYRVIVNNLVCTFCTFGILSW